MIQGTYYKEWSTVLGREMEFKVYGHAGVPVLALPARGGRFYDWENNGMPDAIAQLLNEGKVQLFCADAMDGEGLLNGDLPQRRRAELQELSPAHHGDGIGQNESLLLIVRDKDHRSAELALDALELAAHAHAQRCVKV